MDHDDSLSRPEGPRRIDPEAVELIDPKHPAEPRIAGPRGGRLHDRTQLAILLFVATCISTTMVGGLSYAVPLMCILLAHEMGHFLQAKRYGVPATLPLFIPLPIKGSFGTMGAVIIQGAGVADRKSLFDIAISGPLAGLALALPIAYVGVAQSTYVDIVPGTLLYGDPLIFQWMYAIEHGPLPEGQVLLGGPLMFAGWVGIFITALNLIPIGQLDGGHILYTLIGKRSHLVGTLVLFGAVGYMAFTHYYAYSLMVLLLLLMGPRHPPTANDKVPLGPVRVVLGWLTLAFVIIGFTPTPIIFPDLDTPPRQYRAEDRGRVVKEQASDAGLLGRAQQPALAERQPHLEPARQERVSQAAAWESVLKASQRE